MNLSINRCCFVFLFTCSLSTSDYELPDILSQNAIVTNQPDSFDLSLQPSTDETIGMTNYSEVIRTDSVPVSRPLPSISSRGSLRTKMSEGLDKRSRRSLLSM